MAMGGTTIGSTPYGGARVPLRLRGTADSVPPGDDVVREISYSDGNNTIWVKKFDNVTRAVFRAQDYIDAQDQSILAQAIAYADMNTGASAVRADLLAFEATLGTASTHAEADFIAAVAPGATNNVLTSNGSGNWISAAPTGGGGSASVTFSAVNRSGSIIHAGWVVMANAIATGIMPWDGTRQALGLVVADVADSVAGTVQTTGPFTLSDWTAVTGASTLTSSIYWADPVTHGMLTTTVPSGGQIALPVGGAVSTTEIDIVFGTPIKT